jgi:hypothetical protein
MGTADPAPVNIADIPLATMVLILGIFFIIVGIVIAGVIYRESREWRKLVMPMFEGDSTEAVLESPKEPDRLTPRMAALGKEIFGRIFTHMDVAGLLGGAAAVILGILIVLISFPIGQL